MGPTNEAQSSSMDDVPATQTPEKENIKETCYELVTTALRNVMPSIWHRILPRGDDNREFLNIAQATGISWEDMLPLLVACGLLKMQVTSGAEKIEVSVRQWDELAKSLRLQVHFEITSVRLRNQPRQHFFAIGKPLCSSPLKQVSLLYPCQVTINTKSEPYFQKILELSIFIRNQWLQNRAKDKIEDRETTTNAVSGEVVVQKVVSEVEQQIENALSLDLDKQPRLSRTNGELITVHKRKQADERARHMAIHTAVLWGWNDPTLTLRRRNQIALAACQQVAYDFGYPKPLASTSLPSWYSALNSAITSGESTDPLSPHHYGRQKKAS